MFIQKLYKTGNSVAVTIPKHMMEELGLKEGSEVVVEKAKNKITLSPKASKLASDVTPEFMKMVKEFADKHDDVLRELADR